MANRSAKGRMNNLARQAAAIVDGPGLVAIARDLGGNAVEIQVAFERASPDDIMMIAMFLLDGVRKDSAPAGDCEGCAARHRRCVAALHALQHSDFYRPHKPH